MSRSDGRGCAPARGTPSAKAGRRVAGVAVLTVILCAALAFFGIFGGVFNKNGNFASAKAMGSTELVLSEDTEITNAQSNDYKTLINLIAKAVETDSTVNNYKSMDRLMTEKGVSTIKATSFASYKVKFGGYTWNIAFVSRTSAPNMASANNVGDEGDVVVTLYLADVGKYAGVGSTIISQFSDKATDNVNVTYPSSMYSTSIVRSSLNGTQYSTNNNTLNAGTQNSVWTRFTAEDQLGQYISTPTQIAYQKTEYTTTYSNYFPNDAYGKVSDISGHTWYKNSEGGTRDMKKIQDKTGYGDWQTDKLWLPSMSETGWDTTNVGMWGLTADQRALTHNSGDSESYNTAAGDTRYSWLRSGSNYNASYASLLSTSGGNHSSRTYNYYGVRPALHLNLKSAASAAGVELPVEIEGGATYNNGTFVPMLERVDEHLDVASAKVVQTHRDETKETKNLTSSDYEIVNGVFSAKLAGEYSVEFALAERDDGIKIWDTVHYNDGVPANMVGSEYVDALFWEIPDAAGNPTYTIVNQTVTFTVKKQKPPEIVAAYTAGVQLYTGGALPALTHTGGIAGEARLDEGQALDHEKTDPYNWTFYPEDDLNYNDELKGTVELDVKKPEIKDMSVTFDVTAYNNAVTAGTAEKIYSSNTLAEVKDIIKPFITIDSAIKEDGKDFEDLDVIKEGFILGFDGDKTKLEGGKNNTLTFSFGGVTVTLSGAVPVLTVDLDKIEITHAPTTTAYTALETFKTAGMVVTATYTDGKSKAVTGYSIIYNNGHTALWYHDTSVTVSYSETNEAGTSFTKTADVNVTVSQITFFVNDVTLDSVSKPYTGSAQTIALGGTALPEGITAQYSYEKNDSRIPADQVVNAGEYKVIVDLIKDNVNGENYRFSSTPQKTATLTITKVDYAGVDRIAFENGSAQYSAGSAAGAISVKNVPDGVTVTYEYFRDENCTDSIDEANVVAMGEYYVKATFAVDGNHNDIAAMVAKLTVIAHTLTSSEVSGVDTSYTYKGEAWKPAPTVTVTLNGVATVLNEGTDYDVTYSTEDYTAGTSVTVTVTGKGNFSGSVEKRFQITKATLSFEWAYEGAGVYDGSVHSAVIKIDDNGVCVNDRLDINTDALAALINGEDGSPSISYTTTDGNSARTAAGTYKPRFSSYPTTVSPWSNYDYEFTNANFDFTVAEAVLPTIEFNDKTVTYDGQTHFMEITVTGGELNTKEIEVKYYFDETNNEFIGRKNVNVVSSENYYRVRVEIKCTTGNYTIPSEIATMYAKLIITPREITDADVSGVEESYVYNGKEIAPALKVALELTEGGAEYTLSENSEYSLSYEGNRIDVSGDNSVTVKITGVDNFSGEVSKQFKITQARLGWEWEGTDVTYTYNGSGQGVTARLTGVADRDLSTIVPTIYYVGRAGTDYAKSTDKPVNAGNYTVIISLEVPHDNYGTFSDRQETFTILKADPKVTVNYTTWNGTDHLYRGQLLPEITAVTTVTGSVGWKPVNGEPPVLLINTNEYTWIFTPEGDDANNYNTLEGTLSIQAHEPTFKSMTWRWNTDDGQQPFLWSSTTLDELREYLWVEAELTDGTNFGRVTTLYSLAGKWGNAASPKENGYDETRNWDIDLGLGTLNETITGVTYNLVVLDRIEVTAADGYTDIKKNYDALSVFDRDSIKVTAHYKDGSKIEDIKGYTVTYQQSDERLWWGNNHVVIGYKDNTVSSPVTFTVDGLNVSKIVFDTSGIVFGGAVGGTVTVPYDGNPHSLTLDNADSFTIGTISYVYKVRNGSSWDTLDGVSEVTAAGEYRIEATLTIVDDELLGEGVYTLNYTLSSSLKSVNFTISKIKYEGADDISIPTTVTADFNGDTSNLYAADIMKASSGVSSEVWAIAKFEYRVVANGDVLEPSAAVHAGSYFVTIIFENDDNHEPIASRTIRLTVNKIDPKVTPKIVVADGVVLVGMSINQIALETSEGDPEGTFVWVANGSFDPSTYVTHSGANTVFYKFTPRNTTDYNVLECEQLIITAKVNFALSMYAQVYQGDTELFTSYTLDKLLQLAADENEDLTIKVYLLFNDGTEGEITDYTVTLAGGGNMLTAGDCKLIFTYEIDGTTFTYSNASVKVHDVGLGRIEVTFDQKDQVIFTSDGVDDLQAMLDNGEVELTFEAFYNNGDPDPEGALEIASYVLSGDWSAMTADGKFTVTVTATTVGGESASATFDIDVTLVILTGITANYDQNGAKLHASNGISALETLIADGSVIIEVKAQYNDGSEKTVAFGVNGYSVSIDTALFTVGENTVTVSYNGETCTFTVEVTAVLVERLHAEINDVTAKIYTDTPISDVENLLTVTAFYNDGTSGEVTDFEITGTLTAGTQVTVGVDYTGADKADYFETFGLIIGVIKHETAITFSGDTEYTYDGFVKVISDGAATNRGGEDENLTYTIDGVAASVLSAGEYILVITSGESDNYYSAQIEVKITVNKATYDMSGVTFADKTVTYDGTTKYLYYDGAPGMGVLSGVYSYADADGNPLGGLGAVNAGTYIVTVSFGALDLDNYYAVPDMTATLTIEKAEVVIDESGLFANTYAYNGSEQTVTGATIVRADDGAEIVYGNNTFTGVPAGGVLSVEISVAEGDNYKPFRKTFEIAVHKAALTLTAKDYEITYGEAPANDGVITAGFVNEEDEQLLNSLVYTYNYSQYGNVGAYEIALGGVSSDNYEITLVSGVLTVKKAEATVNWTTERYVYDGAKHAPSATFTDLFGTEISLNVVISGANGGVVSEAVSAGDYVANASTSNPNYELVGTAQPFTIEASTDYFVKFDFRKDYTVTYGSVPETAEELAALAELLINQSYVRPYYNGVIADVDDLIRLMTVRLEADSTTPVTAATSVGRYNICFEFKPEYAEDYANYTVYQTVENSENTNLGRLIIERRALTVEWGDTQFKSDGTAHLLTANVKGFIDGETPVSFTMKKDGGEFSFDIDGTTVKFTLTVSGDFTSVGGHEISVVIDDGNYVIANSCATVSISEASGLSTLSWALIGVAAGAALIAVIAIIVAAKRKKVASEYDADGFNELYYGDEQGE